MAKSVPSSDLPCRFCTDLCLLTCRILGSGTVDGCVCTKQIIKWPLKFTFLESGQFWWGFERCRVAVGILGDVLLWQCLCCEPFTFQYSVEVFAFFPPVFDIHQGVAEVLNLSCWERIGSHFHVDDFLFLLAYDVWYTSNGLQLSVKIWQYINITRSNSHTS